jgi:arginine deiminase
LLVRRSYFRIEVPLRTEQNTASEIICVHSAHKGNRVPVKAPSNTSNLRKHLSNAHGIVVEGTRGASHATSVAEPSGGTVAAPGGLPNAGRPGALANGSARVRKAAALGRVKREVREGRARECRGQGTSSIAGVARPPCGACGKGGGSPTGLHQTGQVHEDDDAAVVVVCAPSLSKTMGALHPAGALYARPVHFNQAQDAHAAFVALLRRRGIETHDVRDILARDAEWSMGDRCRLEDLAAKSLTYAMSSDAGGEKSSGLLGFNQHYVSEEYKRSVLREMDVNQLVDIVMTNPTVTITDTGRDTGFLAQYAFTPSTNIMFCRDQQVTTVNGVVMARLQAPQRRKEVDVLEFCLRKLGVNVLGGVERGFLEGGDFFPCGTEMCFVGVGPRSTYPAVAWMMERDMLGTEQVVVVRDEVDMSQDRMHLDCVFNIIGRKVCLMAESIIGEHPENKSRVVDVWREVPDDRRSAGSGDATDRHGRYQRVAEDSDVEFSSHLRSIGFTIIPITADEQLEYGCNVLNLGGGRLISTERNSARRIAMHPSFTGTVEFLDFSAVTAMYGGVHCASQVVRRNPA